MYRFTRAKSLRQVTPGAAGAITVDDSINKQAVVCGVAIDMANAAWQKIFDPAPLIIAKCVVLHVSTSLKPTLFEPETKRFENPKNNKMSGGKPLYIRSCGIIDSDLTDDTT